MQALYPELAVEDNFIIAGPLNLNRRMMRADTVMGERLQLSPPQFRTLLMLVSNEGVHVSFEDLHMFMTMPDEEKCSIQAARDVVTTLVNIVNISGRGFARINVLPNDEYVFVTKWGMDWRSPAETGFVETKSKQDAAKSTGKFSKIVLSIAMTAALFVFIGTYFAFQASENGLIYIPMAQIPLAAMPDFERSVVFPTILDDTFFVSAEHGIYVDTYNMSNSRFVFVLCVFLADNRAPLSSSVLVPRGDATNAIYLFESLESGRYVVEFSLRAFCEELLTEVESKRIHVTIYVE